MVRYKILDSRISGTSPGRIVAKVLIDQAVTAPPILATFYTGKPFHAYVVLTRLRIIYYCIE